MKTATALVVFWALVATTAAQEWATLAMPGSLWTYPQGIEGNNVVGFYTDFAYNEHGFLYNLATTNWTILNFPGADETYVYGIKGSNIVGSYYIYLSGKTHGFHFDGVTWKTIDWPSAVGYSGLLAIEGSNVFLGVYLVYIAGNNFWYPYKYQDGQFTTIGPSGIQPNGISGTNIVGESTGFNNGFIMAGSYMYPIVFKYPKSESTSFNGICGNHIVGEFCMSNKVEAFVCNLEVIKSGYWNTTNWARFNIPASRDWTSAAAIDGRNVVGTYYASNYTYVGFIYKLPEASLGSSTSSSSTNLSMSFTGIPGQVYKVQFSADLALWTNVASYTISSTNPVTYSAPTTNSATGYYRIMF